MLCVHDASYGFVRAGVARCCTGLYQRNENFLRIDFTRRTSYSSESDWRIAMIRRHNEIIFGAIFVLQASTHSPLILFEWMSSREFNDLTEFVFGKAAASGHLTVSARTHIIQAVTCISIRCFHCGRRQDMREECIMTAVRVSLIACQEARVRAKAQLASQWRGHRRIFMIASNDRKDQRALKARVFTIQPLSSRKDFIDNHLCWHLKEIYGGQKTGWFCTAECRRPQVVSWPNFVSPCRGCSAQLLHKMPLIHRRQSLDKQCSMNAKSRIFTASKDEKPVSLIPFTCTWEWSLHGSESAPQDQFSASSTHQLKNMHQTEEPAQTICYSMVNQEQRLTLIQRTRKTNYFSPPYLIRTLWLFTDELFLSNHLSTPV